MLRTTFLLVLISVFATVFAYTESHFPERIDENGVTWIGPIRKCDNGDDAALEECVRLVIKDLTPLVGSGIEELGLQPLDPVEIKKFSYERSLGPINITLLAKNTLIHQLSNYKFLNFKVDAKNMRMSFTYEVPYVKLDTYYKLGGKVFFFPLTGTGPAKLELFNLRAEGEFNGKIVRNKNGEEVTQVVKTIFHKMSITDMNLSMRGLFDGNALLSSVVHYIGKRYAPEVFEVLRPDLADFASNMITHDLLNPILAKLPHVVEYIPRRA